MLSARLVWSECWGAPMKSETKQWWHRVSAVLRTAVQGTFYDLHVKANEVGFLKGGNYRSWYTVCKMHGLQGLA